MMKILRKGKIHNGQVELAPPLPLAEGTEVRVEVRPVSLRKGKRRPQDFTALPFFGMWADREDLGDSTNWVQMERLRWHQRAGRTD